MDYFELLKAKRGLPVSDAYTALLGKKLQGDGYPVTEIFSQLPFSFLSRGESISEWTMYGNTVQNGTPTPTSPIPVQGVGDRTANLAYGRIDAANISSIGVIGRTTDYDVAIARVESGIVYTANSYVIAFYTDEPTINSASYDGSRIVATPRMPTTFTAPITGFVAIRLNPGEQAMINLGSTDLPYEPYGHKIQISCSGTTQTVYLDKPLYGDGTNLDYLQRLADGSGVEHRAFGVYVFDGSENWDTTTSADNLTRAILSTSTGYIVSNSAVYSTHYRGVSGGGEYPEEGTAIVNAQGTLILSAQNVATTEDWKAYLAAQHSAGTPVTVVYQLATPTSAPVTLPEIPTAVGTNTLTTATAVHGDARIKGRIEEV